MAAQNLVLHDYELQTVLLPGKDDRPVKGIRITVTGAEFPMRALQPEILVGEESAEMVEITPDLRSVRGYLRKVPKDGAVIRVRYGQSQEGELRERVNLQRLRPLADDCT